MSTAATRAHAAPALLEMAILALRVPMASILPLLRRHALRVQAARLTSTPIHPLHVPRAMLARMQLVAALSARLVWLVRLIWMHQQQLHAKLVLLAHSPLRVPPRVMLALSEQLTPTATLPRRAKWCLRIVHHVTALQT